MKLAFKRAAAGGFVDHAIGFMTHSPFCHVELVFEDDAAPTILADIAARKLKLIGLRFGHTSLCFSSDAPDGGTRFKWIDLTDPKQWTIVPLPDSVSMVDVHAAVLCGDFDGLKYDWVAIAGFVLPLGEYAPSDRICSGVVSEVLIDFGMKIGDNKDPWRNSPGMLYKAVMQK